MKNKGWVKLWRDQFNNWISKKPFCDGYAWSYLYSRANHKKKMVNFRNEYIEVERGQFLTSKLKLQEIFGWTRRHIENLLKALKNDEMITYRVTNRYIIITIINYEKYQSKEEQNDIQNDNQVTNRRQTGLKRGTTNKNDKNVKKKKFLDSILLTTEEYKKLINEYGEGIIEKKIEDLQRYIARTGKKYASHYLTIKAWLRKDEAIGNNETDKPEHNTIDLRKEYNL